MKKLDFTLLEAQIKEMTPRSRLYKLLKKELMRQNHWKNKARGKPNADNFERKVSF